MALMLKVAVRSPNKERQNPIKGRKKSTGFTILNGANIYCEYLFIYRENHENTVKFSTAF
jgi:hypothetical protein